MTHSHRTSALERARLTSVLNEASPPRSTTHLNVAVQENVRSPCLSTSTVCLHISLLRCNPLLCPWQSIKSDHLDIFMKKPAIIWIVCNYKAGTLIHLFYYCSAGCSSDAGTRRCPLLLLHPQS